MQKEKPLKAKRNMRPWGALNPKFSGRRLLDSAQEQINLTGGNPYLVPQRVKPRNLPEEMPTDAEGIRSRTRRMKCQSLYSKISPEKILRSNEEAWKLVLDNLEDVFYAMRRARVLYPHSPHGEHYFALGIDEAFQAARTWTGEKKFSTYLQNRMKGCWRPMRETYELVPMPSKKYDEGKKYGKWKLQNPQGTPEEYSRDAGIGIGEAEDAARYHAIANAIARPECADGDFNGGGPKKGDGEERNGNASSRLKSAQMRELHNPLDTELLFGSRKEESVSGRLWDVLEAALTPRQFEIMWMHFEEGLTFEEIGNRLGISTQSAHKTHAMALERLRKSREHSGELRSCMEAFR
ncbi:hypothetical protein JW721_05505 [Candidatus Micrarchaeota archaeon]|nr:hypothetical protein [Candidatus Micrarchaeota archaeon]